MLRTAAAASLAEWCLCRSLSLTRCCLLPSPSTHAQQAQQLRAKIVTQDNNYDLPGYKQLLDDLRGLSANQEIAAVYEELVAAFPTAVSGACLVCVSTVVSTCLAPSCRTRPRFATPPSAPLRPTLIYLLVTLLFHTLCHI